MRKRRISVILLSMIMLMSLLWGCGDEAKKTLKEEGGKVEQADDNQPSSGQVIEDNSEQPDDNGDVNIGDANNNTGTENPDANDTMSENDDTKSDNTKNENTEVSDDVEEIITCRYQLDGTEYYLLNHRKVMYVDKDGNKKELGEFSYDTGGTFEGKDGVCYLLTDDYGTLLVFEPEKDEVWKIMYGVSWYKIFDTDRILVKTDDEVMHYVNFREFLDETEDIPEDMLPYINPPKLTKPSEYPYAVIETPNKEQQDAYEAFIRKREPVKEEAEKENWTWRVQDGVLKNKEGEVYPDVEHIMPGSLYETESVVYYADCNEIHQMKLDGTDNKVIYVASENVYDIIGTEEYIFFALQNSSWRLHIESGICDFACEHDSDIDMTAIDNHTIGINVYYCVNPLTEGDFPEFFKECYYSEYDL